ncbi:MULTISPECIES: AbiV family abortive infection protein [unclassified Mycolicibacterium]|uniref:AbiV family abortive infection protein n=1 Tax=unclassified Mycolicibacterium TaxID=2636767 RepID=UPI0012DEEE64|nr:MULTISPECIES: AbiV family abortive infection protein [unclassified Mycolicibacterium]MUL81311.1 AbiV family abortive infection protein [Mycolicibacterium sp. CBMA 329]MUL87077.1 AbiV family abortive infection protein [Mycolicibacterium sp. CBMA 331]MUL98641.1 AbiV family abortive infection protein [Mycolicibacterium sp. CBMA 334]MUM28508.1 AbiV family abortive infection protein [Mycolicibacterium sp. CBMA 295]MUM37374.1 AbiV family abortive infection protein [Mycolicibacterium sp. CBMA 247]
MGKRNILPPLTPEQVVELHDELLANADRLLTAALDMLESGSLGLARSLAILGLEESGKAIAIHERRREIAYEDEGSAFVDSRLELLWSNHQSKLALAYDFLVREEFWFGTGPSDPETNRAWLGEVEAWTREHNELKQRGFYVDVDAQTGILSPESAADEQSLREVIGHVHQIGWQLRLGEHIVAKQQEEFVRATPPASEEEIARLRDAVSGFAGMDASEVDRMCEEMRAGKPAGVLNNDAYRLRLPEPGANPFLNLGRRGYEAETRELFQLAEQLGLNHSRDEAGE